MISMYSERISVQQMRSQSAAKLHNGDVRGTGLLVRDRYVLFLEILSARFLRLGSSAGSVYESNRCTHRYWYCIPILQLQKTPSPNGHR